MPDYDAWKANAVAISAPSRAVNAWRRINQKPSSIVIVRDTVGTLAAQTVRIEFGTITNDPMGAVGRSAMREVTIFGVRDHPSVADTDIKRGDRFVVNGLQYKVVDVITTHGEIQARAEALS